jgi:hypothetical protein
MWLLASPFHDVHGTQRHFTEPTARCRLLALAPRADGDDVCTVSTMIAPAHATAIEDRACVFEVLRSQLRWQDDPGEAVAHEAFHTLRTRLGGWDDLESAAHALAQCLGVVAQTSSYGDVKGLYWTQSPVSNALYGALRGLQAAGIVEPFPDDDTIVRWNPAFQSPAGR